MIRNILLLSILVFVSGFFYITLIEYLSEENKIKINKNRTEVNIRLEEKMKNIPVLKNDTFDVVHFNSEINEKNTKIKRNFWDLIKLK
tara:strand:- start:332 stop:595 length:264 start_codon:yes stop_codon:yes gene_type:complete